ncbi:hypothetical protein AB6A40_007851 [Gnathostoma spinigerum]|uniref:SKA complex subunit 1 n=1 Tax=Gnathostoma spinigerum TaxID=75299 RepID=A0ABD6EX48_9BILA
MESFDATRFDSLLNSIRSDVSEKAIQKVSKTLRLLEERGAREDEIENVRPRHAGSKIESLVEEYIETDALLNAELGEFFAGEDAFLESHGIVVATKSSLNADSDPSKLPTGLKMKKKPKSKKNDQESVQTCRAEVNIEKLESAKKNSEWTACSNTKQDWMFIAPLTKEEFDQIPRVTRGRTTVKEVNEIISKLDSLLSKKKQLLSRRKNYHLTQNERAQIDKWLYEGCSEIEGRDFVEQKELHDVLPSNLKRLLRQYGIPTIRAAKRVENLVLKGKHLILVPRNED